MSFKSALTATEHAVALDAFKRGVRLLIRGAAHELVEHHNCFQPEADIAVLSALFVELDEHVDFSTLQVSDTLNTIRTSLENERAEAVAETQADPNLSDLIAEYDRLDDALGGDCVTPRDFAHEAIREALGKRLQNEVENERLCQLQTLQRAGAARGRGD